MSRESIKALERIVALCEKSENLTMRQVRMFDVALEGLGMVRCQREEVIAKWRDPIESRITERRERRERSQEAA